MRSPRSTTRCVAFPVTRLPLGLVLVVILGLTACAQRRDVATARPVVATPADAGPAGVVAPSAVPIAARRSVRVLAATPIFQLDRVVDVKLELDAQALASLRNQPRVYTRATVTVDGERMIEVGVRLKGHRSFRDLGDRPSYLLDFKRFSPKRRLHGLRKLVLNSMVEDPTLVREVLGYELFRKAGVTAPRTGYVRVTVNGKHPQLYLAVEPIDKTFLTHRYANPKGNLYEGEYGCDVNREDVWGFDLDAGRDTSRADFKALAALMPRGVTVVFGDGPGGVDREQVLAFLAMSVVVGDFDGYEHHHNYFLYHEPSRDRWSMMPWGIDRAFFDDVKPYACEGLIARMCFADRACRVAYVAQLRSAVGLLEAANLPERVSAIDALIGSVVAADTHPPRAAKKRRKKRAELLRFVRGRAKQLAKWTDCLRGGKERDQDGDGYGCMDCDDQNPAVHPGAAEVCDGVDNNCSGQVDDAPQCPCTVSQIDGVRFELCDLPMPWLEAARYCKAKGMHLARVDSKAQSKALYQAGRRVRKTQWWLGLNDRQAEDQHVWDDGTKVGFTHWKSGEPSDMACGEDCVALAKRAKGKWYDSHCGLHRAFICRAPDAAAATPAQLVAPGK